MDITWIKSRIHTINMSDSTMITKASGYDVSNIIFGKPENKAIPNNGNGPTMSYFTIPVKTANPDGTVGDLVLEIEDAFCFGVQANTDQITGKINGYTIPIPLWSKTGPSQSEKEWVDTFNRICDTCADYLYEHKEDVEKYDLERSDLRKFNPLYWKREKGKIVDGTGPTLYGKLMYSKKTDKIATKMYRAGTDEILELNDVMGKYFRVNAAVKIESIYVGAKPSLQVKISEVNIKFQDQGPRRLLSRPLPNIPFEDSNGASSSSASAPRPTGSVSRPPPPPANSNSDDEGSIDGDDDDVPPPPPKPTTTSASSARKTVPPRKK